MNFANRYLDAELVERLNHLQVAARRVVEGTAAGLHRSQLKGASVEFRQHRAYVAGDEPRRLDWRLLARTDRPFVKEYDEETNLRCLLMLDCSGSMGYGGAGLDTKFEYAGRIVAALSYLMLASSESVGLAMVSPKLESYLAPRGGSGQLSRVIDLLERVHAGGAGGSGLGGIGAGGIGAGVLGAANRLGRRALVILVSDFFSPVVEIRDALARLRHDRHEVICLRVLHPDEQSFPFKSWSLFQGMEGERGQLCEPAVMRKNYLANFERHGRELSAVCRMMSAELHVLSTETAVAAAAAGFLKSRSRGRRR